MGCESTLSTLQQQLGDQVVEATNYHTISLLGLCHHAAVAHIWLLLCCCYLHCQAPATAAGSAAAAVLAAGPDPVECCWGEKGVETHIQLLG